MLKAVICDVDGTITNANRRIDTRAIERIRELLDAGVKVAMASGNTICFMDCLTKMVGTDGTVIAENGGAHRVGFAGRLHISGNQEECWRAFDAVKKHFLERGVSLELYSPTYRFADVAFAHTVDPAEVRDVLADQPVRVLDTTFAIHLQSEGVTKGTALRELAAEMEIDPADFLAVGDSLNDIEMLRSAGIGAAVGNAHPDIHPYTDWVSEKKYGEGFIDVLNHYSHLLF